MKKLPEHISLYRRSLPPFLIPFTSTLGKSLFKEALLEGNMENFFELSEQYVTQSRPEDCAVSSLVMLLNSLGIDPGRKWKGPWRWYDESLLNCVDPTSDGLSLHQFLQLALCNRSWGIGFYTSTQDLPQSDPFLCGQQKGQVLYRLSSIDTFRAAVVATSRQSKFYLAANYSRKALKQTGEGHYSPIAGYNQKNDMCLILDVARFKYPAYWCPLHLIYEALDRKDPVSLKSRGFVCLSRSIGHYSHICARQVDYVSLKKIGKVVSARLLKEGHPEVMPIIFRLFHDFYEENKCEEEISEILSGVEKQDMHESIVKMVDELNPGVKNASRVITSIMQGGCKKWLKYQPYLGMF